MKFCTIVSQRNLFRIAGIVIFGTVLYFTDIKSVFARIDHSAFIGILICIFPITISYLFRTLRFRIITSILFGPQKISKMFHAVIVESGLMQISSLLAPPIKLLYTNCDGHTRTKCIYSIFIEKFYDYIFPFYFAVGSLATISISYHKEWILCAWLVLTFFIRKPVSRIFIKTIIFITKFEFSSTNLKSIVNEIRKNNNKSEMLLGNKCYIYSILSTAMFYICFYIISLSIDLNLTFTELFIVLNLSTFIGIIPFTFLGFGTRDAGLAALFHLFGRSLEDAVLLSFGMLTLRIFMLLFGGIWWLAFPPNNSRIIKISSVEEESL